MNDLVFIGMATNPRFAPDKGKDFGAFRAKLEAVPEAHTERVLQRQLQASGQALVRLFQEEPDAGLRTGTEVVRHTAAAMAQEQLEIHQAVRDESSHGLGWVVIAREVLLDAAPSGVDIKKSIIFNNSVRTLTGLSRITLASFEPYGAYSRLAFASGIATGEIISSRGPIEPTEKPEA
jgi:hypothetical protein